MAERRMFSKRIIGSARFLMMPLSSQALYFHLGCYADDDGVVEAFSVLRQTNASEDDLRVLIAKGFIVLLNEDLVAYIMDWRENNQIRSDRKIDSIYQNLLLKAVPEAKILEPKERADLKKNNFWTSSGRPMDNQWTPQDSIGKVSIVQDSNNNPPISPQETAKSKKSKKSSRIAPTEGKVTFAEFVAMTNAEFEALIADPRLGTEAAAHECIEILNDYKGSSGKRYKSDFRAIRSWVIDRYLERHRNDGVIQQCGKPKNSVADLADAAMKILDGGFKNGV